MPTKLAVFSMPETGFVAILRHGAYHQLADVPSARQPFPLTGEGRVQAREGADTLDAMIRSHGLTISPMIYCSRQLRAWQTATELASRLHGLGHTGLNIVETSDLAERGLGSAANLTVGEIETALRDDPRYDLPPAGWKSDSDYCLPLEGAESLMQAGTRVAKHLRHTAKAGVLCVHIGHGASFRHACHRLGVLERKQISKLSMFHAQPLLFCHQSHDTWSHLAGAWKVRAPQDQPID